MKPTAPTGLTYSRDRDHLLEDGFVVAKGLLAPSLITALRDMSLDLLSQQAPQHFERFAHHGSMVPLDYGVSRAAKLIGNEGLLAYLRGLGFPHPKWLSGYVISKPPNSAGLWWHQDWWAWGDPLTRRRIPAQIACLVYLDRTTPRNGCLRVIPGSHRVLHPLLQELPDAHGEDIEALADSSSAHRLRPDETDVPTEIGDVVLCDVRLLHATHPNASEARRSCIDLWYLPDFDELPPRFQAHYVQHPCLPKPGWWKTGASRALPEKLKELFPRYEGLPQPPIHFTRRPSTEDRRT